MLLGEVPYLIVSFAGIARSTRAIAEFEDIVSISIEEIVVTMGGIVGVGVGIDLAGVGVLVIEGVVGCVW
jgi:hypothetical protein